MPRSAFESASGSAFKRAREYGQSPGIGRSVLLISICSGLLLPALILDLGLIVQLLVSRGSNEAPNDWVLGPWVSGQITPWPLFANYELCLLTLVGFGCAVAILQAIVLRLLESLIHKQALDVTTRLRREIHAQVFRLGTQDLLGTADTRPEGLFTDKMEQLRGGLVAWRRTVPSSWVALASLIVLAVAVNSWLAMLAVVLSASLARLHRGLRSWSDAGARESKEKSRKVANKLRENLRLASVSVGYGLAEPPGERFETILQELGESEFRANTSKTRMDPAVLLTILLACGFLLLVVGLRDDVTIAGTVVLGAALNCAYFPAVRLQRLRRELSEAERAAAIIFQYLDRDSGLTEIPAAQALDRVQRDIKLDHITLADRNGRRLLDEVSLRIPAGERIAVLASDPETPIAFAGLFVRFYDPAAGRILYDDHDICRATLDTVRGQALLVSANGPLFPETVADNIACGDSRFTTLQIADAAKQASAYDFIQALPDGFSTLLGSDGLKLSTDRHFRIALSRAVLREPSLLVIEEPAGHFSESTMHQLEAAVEQASAGRTVVLLPSMILSLRTTDRVFLFHEGRLEAEGTHAELVQNNELYRIFRNKVKW
jgi:ATP-binding cassette subfamily B protein